LQGKVTKLLIINIQVRSSETTEKSTWESFTELMEDIYYEGILKEQTQEWIQWHWEEYKNNN